MTTHSLICAFKPAFSLFNRAFSFRRRASSSSLVFNRRSTSSLALPLRALLVTFSSSSLKRAYNASFSALTSRYNWSRCLHRASETCSDEVTSFDIPDVRADRVYNVALSFSSVAMRCSADLEGVPPVINDGAEL